MKTKNRKKENDKMVNNDFLVSGSGDDNSSNKDTPMNDEQKRITKGKIKSLIWRIAIFLSVANLILIVMKYVHPIVNIANATFINISMFLA